MLIAVRLSRLQVIEEGRLYLLCLLPPALADGKEKNNKKGALTPIYILLLINTQRTINTAQQPFNNLIFANPLLSIIMLPGRFFTCSAPSIGMVF